MIKSIKKASKMNQIIHSIIVFAIMFFTITSCEVAKDTVDDLDKTAALKNVSITYDSLNYDLGFPEGALDGETLVDLMKKDSSKFANPANYTISFIMKMFADNTKDNAKEAEFDGMYTDIIFDSISSTPLKIETESFTVAANEKLPVITEGSINLATHRQAGLYIFQQIVDGNDISTTISPALVYNINLLEGEIEIPDFQKDIPTKASQETKDFLQDLLNSGILD